MNITHVQGIFSPEHGGPTSSLRNYAVWQAQHGHTISVRVLTGFKDVSPAVRLEPPIDWFAGQIGFPSRLGRSRELYRKLREDITPDIYHLHGTWLRGMHYGAVQAERRSRPYVLELMGMYEPYGLQTKRIVKRVARNWFQDRLLHRATCLHVNSVPEAENLRRLGFTRPIAVIPVGVDLDAISPGGRLNTPPSEACRNDPRLALYLARIVPKKGLLMLLKAWAATTQARNWKLVIAGSGDPAYIALCKATATELGIDRSCVWLGHVSEAEKTRLLGKASFYVLPTYSDNFANSIAEALAHELPVLTTTATPWQEVQTRDCGQITEPNVEGLAKGLAEVTSSSHAKLLEMGRRGAELVREKYSLEATLQSLEKVYEWAIGGGTVPQCIQVPARVTRSAHGTTRVLNLMRHPHRL